MAISPTTGTTASNGTAATMLSAPVIAVTAGQTVIVGVALLNTSASVSTITDTAGNTYILKSAITEGSALRVELWAATNVTANAANVILVTASASSLMAVAIEEYAGLVSTYLGNTATADAASDYFPAVPLTMQDGNNWAVAALAFACTSGDTFTAFEGTIRRSVVPALTSVGIALVDNTNPAIGIYPCGARLSAARAWAAAGVEMRTHSTAVPYADIVSDTYPFCLVMSGIRMTYTEVELLGIGETPGNFSSFA